MERFYIVIDADGKTLIVENGAVIARSDTNRTKIIELVRLANLAHVNFGK